jgi:serine/threonine protein kinase
MLSGRAASEKSDQYALGVMLYECLTGQHAFSGGSYYELMHAILHSPLRPPSAHAPGLPARLERVIVRAMSRDAADRFEDVRALGAALLEFASAETRARWQHAFVPSERRQPCDQDRTEVDERSLLRPLQKTTVSKRPIVRWGVLGAVLAAIGLGAGFVRAGSAGPGRSAEPSATSPPALGGPPAEPPARAAQATSESRTPASPEPPSPTEAAPAPQLERSPARDTTAAATSIAPSRRTTKQERRPSAQPQKATHAAPRPGVAAPAELGRDDVVDPYF